jgi:hypothetical protein
MFGTISIEEYEARRRPNLDIAFDGSGDHGYDQQVVWEYLNTVPWPTAIDGYIEVEITVVVGHVGVIFERGDDFCRRNQSLVDCQRRQSRGHRCLCITRLPYSVLESVATISMWLSTP